jgi:hypothetical protein
MLIATAGPATAAHNMLTNSVMSATISGGRLVAPSKADNKFSKAASVAVAGDDFEIELDGAPKRAGTAVISSASFPGQPTLQPGANGSSLAVRWTFKELVVEVRYSLVSSTAMFVEKQLRLLQPSGLASTTAAARNVTKITLFDRTALISSNAPPASSITASSKYVGPSKYVGRTSMTVSGTMRFSIVSPAQTGARSSPLRTPTSPSPPPRQG